jgi:hypothetical protein
MATPQAGIFATVTGSYSFARSLDDLSGVSR